MRRSCVSFNRMACKKFPSSVRRRSKEASIPQYFFDHCDERGCDRDDDGLELPDFETAYLEAHHAATDIWVEALKERRNPSRERFEIRDTQGNILLVLPFSEITETAQGTRRPPVTFAALQKYLDRTQSLQSEVSGQIVTARLRLCETRETLDRLEAIIAVRGR